MEKLTDESLMPFGKYKDKPLSEVPAWYLAYLKVQISDKAPNKQNLSQKMLLRYINKKEEESEK